jgi:alpha-mannosidase
MLTVFVFFCCMSAAPARAQEAVADKVIAALSRQQEGLGVELAKWKVSNHCNESCFATGFKPDKKWKSAGKGYAFPTSETGVWFWTKYIIPEQIGGVSANGSKVMLFIGVLKSADIYVNGKWVVNTTDNRNDSLLTPNAVPGDEYDILVHGVNRRSGGILFEARLEFIPQTAMRQEANAYINDIKVMRMLLDSAPDKDRWLAAIDKSAALVDLDAFDKNDSARFLASVAAARLELEPVKNNAQQYSLYLIGYSHIDLAWLWDKNEGEEVWLNTSHTVLNLMNDYPDWIYCAGQAAGYRYMERDYPEIFAQIKQRVAEGRWEIVGGTWAEFDSNLPGGESYIRHLLYGKRYFREKFGKDIVVAWTPDSFGYNWNLAQIYKKAGMIGFVTQKINWNDTNKFPYHVFWWEGPDGSRLLTYFPFGGYSEGLETDSVLGHMKDMEKTTGLKETYEIFGVGDHGGGVTRTQLDRAFTFKDDPIFPSTKFITADGYFRHLGEMAKKTNFPVYKNELYLEYHRGTYTSQASTKHNNRFGETALADSELFSSIAFRLGAPYPRADIRDAWDILMFNHFHDVLPGSSINKVYKDTEIDYAKMFEKTGGATNSALKTIASKVNTNGKGGALMLFNPLPWKRDGEIEIAVESPEKTAILNTTGEPVLTQVVTAADGSKKLLFVARGLPADGYATYRIAAASPSKPKAGALKAAGATIENEFFKVTVDPKTGNISSLIDKRDKREYFGGGKEGNMLQAYRDRHPDYDAWNIQLHEAKPVTLASPPEIVENGPVRVTLRWTKMVGESTFVHYLSIVQGVPEVFARLEVDWKESHVMAKLAFQLNLSSDDAWYEIPYAAIPRAAKWKNKVDEAKWEVSAQKWVDYPSGDGKAGFSLLNNSKYGYDTKDNVMRMSLLRSPKEPDPEADMKHHTIDYALYPHAGDWRSAQTPRRGYEFNYPVLALVEPAHSGSLPASQSFFASEPSNVILSSIKLAEDSNSFILRVYEATGKDSTAKITLPAAPKSVEETNLMEEEAKPVKFKGATIEVQIGHYEIKTFKVTF